MKIKTGLTLTNQSDIQIPLSQKVCEEIATLVINGEGRNILSIELVYLCDDDILEMNNEYLNHNYTTDVITFPYHQIGDKEIDGSIFMGAEQILRQAEDLGEQIETEFKRVLIHGLLHLCDFTDENDAQKAVMTEKENFYLCKIDS